MTRRSGSSAEALYMSQRRIAAADSRKDDKTSHDVGWPHYNKLGACMCKCRHCLGSGGCICKGCSGSGHVNCRNAHERAA